MPRFSIGQDVFDQSRRQVGRIASEPILTGGEVVYKADFSGQIRIVHEEDLEVYQGPMDVRELLLNGAFGDHRIFSRRLTMSKLRRPLRDALYSYRAARTDFHAYQFRPLLKFLESSRRRILIADEVGLGKTIETGYILQEERARSQITRILVVCPAALRLKWQNELWNRFGERFEVLDARQAMRALTVNEVDEGKVLPRLQGIVSLQSIRSRGAIDAIEDRGASLDLLIVDEAHHCRNPGRRQHRAVALLSELSDSVVFLTATPIHLGDENLFHLLQLLLPEEFSSLEYFKAQLRQNAHVVSAESELRRRLPGWRERALERLGSLALPHLGGRWTSNRLFAASLESLRTIDENLPVERQQLEEMLGQLNLLSPYMTRTRKREVQVEAAKREAHVLIVEFSVGEREAYERLSKYCLERYAAAGNDLAARFAIIGLQRQLASSLHAAVGAAGDSEGLEIDDDDDEETWEFDPDEVGRPLREDARFLALLRQCRDLLPARDAKLEALKRMLQGRDKVVVFAYYKASLRYLERALSEVGIGCVRIDGDVASDPMDPESDERLQRILRFRDDSAIRVLLSSEVGSEGLDFQFCHQLVNWDLPWNPMVVEQRIGRLDRLGQRSEKILIFSFSIPGTIEDIILQRLYHRIGVFENSIGILEPIIGQEIKELTTEMFRSDLSADEREAIIRQRGEALHNRLEQERKLEGESDRLLGHDGVLADRVDRVGRLGRFVSGEELRLFVSEFLKVRFPACSLRQADEDGIWKMRCEGDLTRFVRDSGKADDPLLQRFLDRAHHGAMQLTFESEVAIRNPKLDLVSATHPLVRAIAAHYDEHHEEVHPVTAVRVNAVDPAVPPGWYLFLWASVEEQGAREGRSLWGVAVPFEADGKHLEGDDAEILLHRMLLDSRAWEDFEPPPREDSERLYRHAEDLITNRQVRHRAERKARNDLLIDRRIESVRAAFEVRAASIDARIRKAESQGKAKGLALFRAQRRKQEGVFEETLKRLESQRKVKVEGVIEGAGYVHVVG
jgi:superfamily II DNA or RNA helicase